MRMSAKPHGTEIKEEHKKFENKKKRTRNDNNTTACAHIPPYALLVPRRLTDTRIWLQESLGLPKCIFPLLKDPDNAH